MSNAKISTVGQLLQELESALAEVERLRAENETWAEKARAWMASPEAAARLDGYRELGDRAATAEAKVERLTKKASILEAFVRDVAVWRWGCHQVDEEAGHAPTPFIEYKAWTHIEEQAAHALNAALAACEEGGPDAKP